MKTYIAQRVGIGLLTLLGMSIVIFGMLRLAPGDIVDILFSTGGYVNPVERVAIEKELGLDRPVWVQYLEWMRQILTGDLGKSYRYDLPAWEIIRPLIPVTLELAILSLIVSVALGVPLGVISAVRQDTPLDYALRVFSLAGLSMPSFWLGMVIILGLVAWIGWIPPVTYVSPSENFWLHAVQFALPSLAVGYRSSALIMRITRSSLLEVMREDYIRTARAKGQSGSVVIWRHALQNAILPVVTVIGIEFAFLIGGLVVTETVFNLPGLARFCRKKPLGAIGGLLMVVMFLTAVFANQLATHDPIATDAGQSLARPGPDHWLGSDHLGRDIYSRVVHGARVSLIVGLASTLLGSVFGGIIGLLSGYVGGKTDLITQRVMDILQGLPLLVLALVMSAALGPSIPNVVLAISIPIIPRAARVIRASVLSIREMQYVEAARAVGLRHVRIAFRHVLPNTMGPFIVLCTAQLGSAILVEAALSFLGLGVPEPYPSWGRMLSVSAAEYAQKAPWLVLFPGLAISLAVFGSNLLGDALRDTLDPRLRGA